MPDQETGNSSAESLRQPFIDITVDSWRFAKVFARLVERLDPTEATRYANQLRYFLKKLDESAAKAGVKIVSFEGQDYNAGLPTTPLNLDEFGPDERLVVDQMVEPVLMGPDGLIKSGTVMLRLSEKT